MIGMRWMKHRKARTAEREGAVIIKNHGGKFYDGKATYRMAFPENGEDIHRTRRRLAKEVHARMLGRSD